MFVFNNNFWFHLSVLENEKNVRIHSKITPWIPRWSRKKTSKQTCMEGEREIYFLKCGCGINSKHGTILMFIFFLNNLCRIYITFVRISIKVFVFDGPNISHSERGQRSNLFRCLFRAKKSVFKQNKLVEIRNTNCACGTRKTQYVESENWRAIWKYG